MNRDRWRKAKSDLQKTEKKWFRDATESIVCISLHQRTSSIQSDSNESIVERSSSNFCQRMTMFMSLCHLDFDPWRKSAGRIRHQRRLRSLHQRYYGICIKWKQSRVKDGSGTHFQRTSDDRRFGWSNSATNTNCCARSSGTDCVIMLDRSDQIIPLGQLNIQSSRSDCQTSAWRLYNNASRPIWCERISRWEAER